MLVWPIMAIKQKVRRKAVQKDEKLGSKDHLKLGFVGEQVTKKHLLAKGLEFVGSNFRRKYGEIDLIMKVPKGDLAGSSGRSGRSSERLMFFEIKTVSYENISRETAGFSGEVGRLARNKQEGRTGFDEYRPEDNVNASKLRKIRRIIKIWLEENKVAESADWSFNVVLVYLSKTEKKFYIKILWDEII